MNVRVNNNGFVVMMMVMMMMVLMLLDMTDAYAAGPPVSTCSSMAPNHGADAQTSPAPYTITTSVTCYTPGQPLTGKILNVT